MSLLIRNGRIVTAVDDYHADIFVEDETVSLIGRDLDVEADRTIDAAGRLVIPGGVDPHTHMDMPFGGTTSADDFETGTRAAAFGGTTTIVDFAIQTKGHSTLEGLETWHEKAAGKAGIDYGFHMIVTDMEDDRLWEMRRLADEGVTSYKMFMAYPGVLYVDDGTLFRAMRKAGEDGTLVCMHAENGIVIDEIVKIALAEGKTSPKYHALTRPTRMEAEGVHRSIAIAEVAGVPVYIVHLSCADALEQVTLARDRGAQVFAETCPQYLFLDLSHYDHEDFEGAKYVMTPPLREKWNQEHLWRGLGFGDLQSISTDPLPLLLQGPEGLRGRRLQQDPERRSGSREPDEPGLQRRRRGRPAVGQQVRRPDLDGGGKAVRDVPEEGDDRRGQRRGHRHESSQALLVEADSLAQEPATMQDSIAALEKRVRAVLAAEGSRRPRVGSLYGPALSRTKLRAPRPPRPARTDHGPGLSGRAAFHQRLPRRPRSPLRLRHALRNGRIGRPASAGGPAPAAPS